MLMTNMLPVHHKKTRNSLGKTATVGWDTRDITTVTAPTHSYNNYNTSG